MVLDARPAARLGEVFFQVLQQAEATLEALGVEAAGQLGVARHLRRIGDHERRILHAQEAGADGREAVADADEMRQIELLRAQFRGHQ